MEPGILHFLQALMLLVHRLPEALGAKDKIVWLFCRRRDLFRMGKPEKASWGKASQSTSKDRGVWKGRGGRKEVETTWENPKRKLYAQSPETRTVQLEQEVNITVKTGLGR